MRRNATIIISWTFSRHLRKFIYFCLKTVIKHKFLNSSWATGLSTVAWTNDWLLLFCQISAISFWIFICWYMLFLLPGIYIIRYLQPNHFSILYNSLIMDNIYAIYIILSFNIFFFCSWTLYLLLRTEVLV